MPEPDMFGYTPLSSSGSRSDTSTVAPSNAWTLFVYCAWFSFQVRAGNGSGPAVGSAYGK
jgi:hypothetical protein